MNIHELIARIYPGIYEHLKTAVETGRWQNGVQLSEEQRALCLQAVIAYDLKHKPEHERVGYVTMPKGLCAREKPVSGGASSGRGEEYRPIKLPPAEA